MSDSNFCVIKTFKEVCQKVKNLMADGKCNLFILTFWADFRLEDNNLLNEEERRTLVREIEPILSFALSEQDRKKDRLRSFLPHDDEDLTDEVLEDLFKKQTIAEDMFINEEIKSTVSIRNTTKHSLLSDLSWEINKKLRTSEKSKKSVVYATISLEFEEKTNLVAPRGNPFIKPTKIIFDCNCHDIDYIIHALNKIKDELLLGEKQS